MCFPCLSGRTLQPVINTLDLESSKDSSKDSTEEIKDGNDYDECAICLQPTYKTCKRPVTYLPCAHKYHQDCIDKWLKRKPNCPMCKIEIITPSGNQTP